MSWSTSEANISQWLNLWNASTLFVIAWIDSRSSGSDKNLSSTVVLMTRPSSRYAW
ncbi:hypothetical protein P1P92_39285 [Streptomyces ipomoeae]|nr:hypothetical protein [Streptomyces ipomoeae]MDX2938374.1 hypothetical protein [Streptomyces ipomoeae]